MHIGPAIIMSRRIFGIPPYAILLAILVGVGLGSYGRISVYFEDRESSQNSGEYAVAGQSVFPNTGADSAAGEADKENANYYHGVATEVVDGHENSVVLAETGLSFLPERASGTFIGYRVIENEVDDRFAVGDIITSINGVPAEDSPAGSELLIAALLNPNAEIALYEAE